MDPEHSGEAPFYQARSLHPTLGSSIMLSPKQAAQPNPSSPTLCRQDTTSPWSTDYGGNNQTLILMPAIKQKGKEIQEQRKEETFFFFETKIEKEKEKSSKTELKEKYLMIREKKGKKCPKRYLPRRLKKMLFFSKKKLQEILKRLRPKKSDIEQHRKENEKEK